MRVALLTAMVQELAPLVRGFSLRAHPRDFGRVYQGRAGTHDVVAAVTSMGTAAATRTAEPLLAAFRVDHVVVCGIAGGIDPALAVGDLVCPEVAILEATGKAVRATSLGPRAPSGRLLTTDTLYNDPASLARLRQEGYAAVDMETAAIAAVAEARGVPWTAFRAISDVAGDPLLDADVVGLSQPDGRANVPAVVRYVLTRPWRVPRLAVLGRGMRRAVRTSTHAVIEALR